MVISRSHFLVLLDFYQKGNKKFWKKLFLDIIFGNIDEMIFDPLYSDKRNFRPNAPVNVIVGVLILKNPMDLRMMRLLKSVSLISGISMLFVPPVMKTSL